jgi:protein involved in polysaccharide export with SLBB domain
VGTLAAGTQEGKVDWMKCLKQIGRTILAGALITAGSGCGNKFFDPAQIGRFRPTPAVNIILDSLGVAEEAPSPWEDAAEPLPEDVLTSEDDYRLGSGDMIRISIYELLMEGRMEISDYVINESGKVSIPDVGIVQAAGLSETALEETIRDILSPNILANPTVSVTLLSSQQRLCSVVGEGVARPGRFMIPRHNFRLSDALAMAGGANQFNVTHIYVARAPENTKTKPQTVARSSFGGRRTTQPLVPVAPIPADATMSEFGELPAMPRNTRRPVPTFQQERQMLGMETPMTQRLWSESEKVIGLRSQGSALRIGEVISPASFPPLPGTSGLTPGRVAQGMPALAAAQTAGARPTQQIEWVFENGAWKPITRSRAAAPAPVAVPPTPTAQTSPAPTQPLAPAAPPAAALPVAGDAPQIEWVFQDGRWVPVQGRPVQAQPEAPAYTFGQDPSVLPLNGQESGLDAGWESAEETRLIQIPKDRLMAGDPKYNIIIKPGDTIYVPVDVVGEFYIMGNVNRTGTINMTGRPVTLKQAVAMAGGLGPLAYPKKCEITRRIGSNREETVLVDLDKIASGEQPDFFIKPNDTINVGTHYSSRWRAVLRNSFRAAWGFGLVYDRNFADDQFGTGFPSWVPFL